MDGLANVAKQQQTQVTIQQAQSTTQQHIHTKEVSSNLNHESQKISQRNIIKEMQNESIDTKHKINSEDQVKKLADELNDALSPLNTTIKFGVDKNDVFYVSVIEEKTHRVIRRFPAEEAQSLLPKMKEVTGILFDSKG